MLIREIARRYLSHGTSCVFKLFSISILLFIASPNYAVAYDGHGYSYGYSYGHHGYGHHGYRGHYSHHGHIGTAGYVFLGILGVAILSHIFDSDNDLDRRYSKSRTYNQPSYNQTRPYNNSINQRLALDNNNYQPEPLISYADNEGWDWLAKGNADYALDIFAIQSQQNLDSGIPRVGFAIAAAAKGDTLRATRAMRKAIRTDATALDKININNINPTINTLSDNYKSNLNINVTDNAFMLATLLYLQQDYSTARNIISINDKSQSANILRELLVKKRIN